MKPVIIVSGELPYGYGNYGYKQKYTNSALYDFAANYRQRQSTEWAPATMSRPDPPALDVPGELYSQHTGLLPGYTGHVPGALFRLLAFTFITTLLRPVLLYRHDRHQEMCIF